MESSRLGVSRAFTGRVFALADTLDIRHVTSISDGDKTSHVDDIAISTLQGWQVTISKFALIRKRIRTDEQKEAEFQRRHRVVKDEGVETLGYTRRCAPWEDSL